MEAVSNREVSRFGAFRVRKDLMPMFFRIRTNAYTFEKDLPVENFDAYKVTKHVYLRDGELKEKEYPESIFVSVNVDKATSVGLDKIFSHKEDANNEINCIKIGTRKFYFNRSRCSINYLNNKAHIVVKAKEDI